MFGLTPVTGHLIMQDTPPCRPEIVKEVAGGFVRLGEKATEVLRRLESGPAFPCVTAGIGRFFHRAGLEAHRRQLAKPNTA
jgi:hypothetical protein